MERLSPIRRWMPGAMPIRLSFDVRPLEDSCRRNWVVEPDVELMLLRAFGNHDADELWAVVETIAFPEIPGPPILQVWERKESQDRAGYLGRESRHCDFSAGQGIEGQRPGDTRVTMPTSSEKTVGTQLSPCGSNPSRVCLGELVPIPGYQAVYQKLADTKVSR